ncbi:peptidase [Alteromonas gracilis]|uniref:peptidase n=1 Tax=Alteromonas gracilis TaxID=1479524 RepID=UPI002FE2A6BF
MKPAKFFLLNLFFLLAFKTNAGVINIEITDGRGLTSSQTDLFESAVNLWESFLIGTRLDIDVNMEIAASAITDDGVGDTLASAGWSRGIRYGDVVYVTNGFMQFDSADLKQLEVSGLLFDVIIHEMAHVIGFGTIWSYFSGLYQKDSGEYLGQFALDTYRNEFDTSANFVPVDIVSENEGTRNGHWAEDWAGPSSDLLTGFLEGSTTISNTTIASFADIGYIVQLPNGQILGLVNAPAMVSLFLITSCFIALRRKV